MPFAVAEFDNVAYDEQIAFWCAIELPIVALIFSGGKSIHAWICVDCDDMDDWNDAVRKHLYNKTLIPYGVDRACSNPGRLSRTPGARRKGVSQDLLYINPTGGQVYE